MTAATKPWLSRGVVPMVVLTLAAAGALTAPPSMAGTADHSRDAPVIGTAGADVIAGHYIVVLAGSADDAALTALSARVVAAGGSVRFTYTAALDGLAATLPPGALEAVRSSAGVAYVEADSWMSPPENDVAVPAPSRIEAPTAPGSSDASGPIWNLDRIDQRRLPLDETYSPPRRGGGVTAYVLDTGIWFTHPEFEARATSGYDFVDDDPEALDCNGHGTHVSGTIGGKRYGVANAVELVALRVLGCDGRGPKSQVIAGVDWVTANADKPAVANMSIGARPSRALDQAVTASIRSGITYTVAAGNEEQDACERSPARARAALTVGATDKTDRQWKLSNFGSCLDLYAPGVLIRSAWPSDTGVTNTISGTSMAAPHVAGVAAVYLAAHPSASAAKVRRAIVSGATEGVLRDLGPGSPDRLVYVEVG